MQPTLQNRGFRYVLLGLFLGLFSLTYHQPHPYFSIENRLFSDEAGYYVYLPATFLYQWDASRFPARVDANLDHGFTVTPEDNLIWSKYPVGVSMLEAPFFGLACLHAWIAGEPVNGFSPPFFIWMGFSSLFYGILGLYLLSKICRKLFPDFSERWMLFLLFGGTSWLYYAIVRPGFSHIYSFFWITAFIYAYQHFISTKKGAGWIWLAVWGIGSTRLLNLAFVPLLMLPLGWPPFSLRQLLRKMGGMAVISLFFVWFPRALYQKLTLGSWFLEPYPGEGFTHWNAPRILPILFSPNNGILLYTPIFLSVFIFPLFRFRVKSWAFATGISFILLTWLYGSWHIWSLGAGYSGRWWVDFLPLWVLAAGEFFTKIRKYNRIVWYSCITFFTLLCGWNQKLMWSAPRYFDGGTWDWREWHYIWVQGTNPEIWFDTQTFRMELDTIAYPPGKIVLLNPNQIVKLPDGSFAGVCNAEFAYSTGISIPWRLIDPENPRRIRIELEITPQSEVTKSALVISEFSDTTHISDTLFYTTYPLDKSIRGTGGMKQIIQKEFRLRQEIDSSHALRIYLTNPERQEFLLHRMKVLFY